MIAHLVEKNLNGGLLGDAVRKGVKQRMRDDSLAMLPAKTQTRFHSCEPPRGSE